jgi:hypothetical protein
VLNQLIHVAPESIDPWSEGHIVINGLGEGVGTLKYHTNFVADLGGVYFGGVKVPALEEYLTGSMGDRYQIIHPVEIPQQGSLPAARRADQRGNFVPVNVQVYVCHGQFAAIVDANLSGLNNQVRFSYHQGFTMNCSPRN